MIFPDSHVTSSSAERDELLCRHLNKTNERFKCSLRSISAWDEATGQVLYMDFVFGPGATMSGTTAEPRVVRAVHTTPCLPTPQLRPRLCLPTPTCCHGGAYCHSGAYAGLIRHVACETRLPRYRHQMLAFHGAGRFACSAPGCGSRWRSSAKDGHPALTP